MRRCSRFNCILCNVSHKYFVKITSTWYLSPATEFLRRRKKLFSVGGKFCLVIADLFYRSRDLVKDKYSFAWTKLKSDEQCGCEKLVKLPKSIWWCMVKSDFLNKGTIWDENTTTSVIAVEDFIRINSCVWKKEKNWEVCKSRQDMRRCSRFDYSM